MFPNTPGRWPSRIVTLLVWLAAGASAAYWGLKLSASSSGARATPLAASGAAPADPAMVAYLLGVRAQAVSDAPVAAAPNRFLLTGVIANHTRQGAALISVDGKPPKPYRVGAQVDTGLILQSVGPRRAVLAQSADGPAAFTLDLPLKK
jgi:general secretion pathway protein C